MPEINQDLKLQSDPSTIVRPNIVSDNIPSGAIDSTKLGASSVTSPKIAPSAVQSQHISAGAVQEAALDSLSVSTAKIQGGAVTTPKLANQAVNKSKAKIGLIQIASGPWSTFADMLADLQDAIQNPAIFRFYADLGNGKFGDVMIEDLDETGNNIDILIGTNEVNVQSDAEAISFYNTYIASGIINAVGLLE